MKSHKKQPTDDDSPWIGLLIAYAIVFLLIIIGYGLYRLIMLL